MTRTRAFTTHLLVSATIVSIVAATVLFVWYPMPYWYTNAADKILLMLVAVDVFVGPTLTLIVFKPGKPGLKMDMTAIITVQLVALIYGTTTLYRERPMFTVFAVDRFEVVTASEIDASKIKYPGLKKLPFAGPGIAYAKKPSDRSEAQKIMMEVLFHRAPDIERRAELYEPISSHKDKIVKRSLTPDVPRMKPEEQRAFRSFLSERNAEQEDFAYFPLIGKDPERNMLLAIDRATALPVAGLKIDPWEISVLTKQKRK